jgi:drug/metabolite transporter (DMT)-like permease
VTATASPASAPTAAVPARRWLPGLVGLGLIWGSSFMFIKIAVSSLPAAYVALGRIFFGAVVLVALLVILGQRVPRDASFWAHTTVVALVGIAAPFTFFSYGETQISSVLAGIWNATTPLIVLPMAVWVFRTERLSPRRLLGLVLGLTGALIILGVWRGVAGASLSGQLFCLAAAACYGIAIPYTKRFLAHRPESGVVMSACQLLIATGVLAIAAPLLSGGGPDLRTLTWPVIGSVVVLGAVGTGIAFVINLHNLRLVGASTASMVTYIIPIFATLLGVLVLHERLDWFQPVGAAVVLLGVAVSQGLLSRRSRPPSRHAPDQPLPLCSDESGEGRT